jgi:hypothetical protein
MNSYKGITFAKDYNKSFAEFKEDFGSTHVFNNIQPEFRDCELEKAYEIAISKSIEEIEVVELKILKSDGNSSRTTNKSKEVTSQ